MTAKPSINLIVCGHVDAGKSTLVGNILFQLGHVDKKRMHKFEQDSKKIGKKSFAFAWIMDESSEERSRGVTIDIAQGQFETRSLIVNVLDAPGHKDFVPNMIAGATQADAALLVVDCSIGEFEAGFADQGQTKEHLVLLKSLGVNQLIVAANKMDEVEWSESRLKEVESILRPFLKNLDFKNTCIQFIPCSGLLGLNLSKPLQNEMTSYDGPTLLDAIDKLNSPIRHIDTPVTRFYSSDVFKLQGSSFGCQGQLEVGRIQTGDKLLVLPRNITVIVKEMTVNDKIVQESLAGQIVTITLTGVIELNDILSGTVLCSIEHPIPVGSIFLLRLIVLSQQPLITGLPVIFHNKSIQQSAKITKLETQIDRSNGNIIKNNPRVLVKKMAGTILLKLIDNPICIETFSSNKELSRFTIRARGETLATGVVLQVQ